MVLYITMWFFSVPKTCREETEGVGETQRHGEITMQILIIIILETQPLGMLFYTCKNIILKIGYNSYPLRTKK